MKNFLSNWWSAIFAAIAIFAQGLVDMGAIENIPWLVWVAIGLLALQFIVAQSNLNRIINASPSIEQSKEPSIGATSLISKTKKGELVPVGHPSFALAYFRNSPKVRTKDSAATNVIAEIEYFDLSGWPKIGKIYGRWAHSRQPIDIDPFDSSAMREILRTNIYVGEEVHLALAMKYLDDPLCYAVDNESTRFPGWKKPDYRISLAGFYVKVTLSGEFEQTPTFWYEIAQGGEDSPMTAKSIDDPFTKSGWIKRTWMKIKRN